MFKYFRAPISGSIELFDSYSIPPPTLSSAAPVFKFVFVPIPTWWLKKAWLPILDHNMS